MDKKITTKNSILFNQLWIKQVIEDGNSHVLVSKKFENCCIGEMIELRYSMENLGPGGPKVTRGNSILYTREWIKKYIDEGLPLPNRKISTKYSLGEVLELLYYQKHNLQNSNIPSSENKKNEDTILSLGEWIEKYHEEGLPLPKGRFSTQSIEKGLELQYYKMNLGKKSSKSQTEKLLVLSGERK